MEPIRTELIGEDAAVLVLRVPVMLMDDASAALRDAVLRYFPRSEHGGVILDFTDVQLVNSIAITCLLQIQDHCKRRSANLVLAAVPPNILRFLKTLALESRFTIRPTVEAGLCRG